MDYQKFKNFKKHARAIRSSLKQFKTIKMEKVSTEKGVIKLQKNLIVEI